MRTLIRLSLAAMVVLIIGIISHRLIGTSTVNLAWADQPVKAADSYQAKPPKAVAANDGRIRLQMVMLEIDRAKVAKLGIDFRSAQTPSDQPSKISSSECSLVGSNEAMLFATALTASGAGKVLAEPTLVASDGRPARFQSGGEFPIVVPQANDTVSVEFRPFGTTIDFLPTMLPHGALQLKIRASQTDLDLAKSVQINGTSIPGLKTHLIDTLVEIQAGKSAMLQNGPLLVIVTPQLVAPLEEAEATPRPVAIETPQIITMRAIVYTFDTKRLMGSDVDIRQMLAKSQQKTFAANLNGKPVNSVVAVLDSQANANLNRQLSNTEGVQLLSRPQIRTTHSQSAKVQIGHRLPIPSSAEVQQASAKFQDVGVSLEVTPLVVGDRLQLRAQAAHTYLKNADSTEIASFQMMGVVKLVPGETLALCQNDEANKQLLVLVTPMFVHQGEISSAASAATNRENGDQQQILHEQLQAMEAELEAAYFPNVVNHLRVENLAGSRATDEEVDPQHLQATLDELFPDTKIKLYPLNRSIVLSGEVDSARALQIIQIAEDFYPNVISHLSDANASSSPTHGQESRTRSRSKLDTAKPPRQARAFLQQEVNELRQDVQLLRRDVTRLLEILQNRDDHKPLPKSPVRDDQSSLVPGNDLPQAPSDATVSAVATWDLASPRITDPTARLQPNDRLVLESLTDKTLNRNVTILADGTITLPLLGQVPVAGRSLVEGREELERLYAQHYRNPIVTLSFAGTSSLISKDQPDDAEPFVAAVAPDPNEVLKPGDRLQLESLSDPVLGRRVTVLADGSVTLPLLGQVPAAGHTLQAFQGQLTVLLKKYFREPGLTVNFRGTSSPR